MTIEKRRSPRLEVAGAVMITPDGFGHEANIFDISEGGARIGLPADWKPVDGAPLRMFFLDDIDCPIMLQGHVARVGRDHLGLAFEPAQERRISELMQLFH